MWVFSEGGFLSAVSHKVKKDTLVVRSRDRVSLEPLAKFAEAEIVTTPKRDYRYRIEIPKTVFGAWMLDQIADLDYDNYKNRVHQSRGNEFAAPLHDVWSVMLEVDDSRPVRSARWLSNIDDWDIH